MNKKLIIGIFALTFVVSAAFLCASVYGESRTEVIFDDPAAFYQIRKSIVWSGLGLVGLILIIVRRIHKVCINRRQKTENFLHETEEILRLLFNGTPDLIIFKDAEGRYLEINDASMKLLGFDRENSKGMNKKQLDKTSLLYRQISENCSSSDSLAWEKGSILRTTEIITVADGEKRTYDVIKSPIFYEDGRKRGIAILARDVSAYKKVEENLEKKERILRATLNATDDAILVVDNNRQVLDANELYFNMWNIPCEIYSLNNEAANIKYIKRQLVEPDSFEAWVNFTYEVPISEHYQAQLLDGRMLDIYSAPLMDKGHMIGRVWSFRDITARVRAENELKKSEKRYRNLVELFPDAIFVSMQDKIIFSNTAAVKLLEGENREDIYKKSILDFVDKSVKASTMQYLSDNISSGTKQSVNKHRIIQLDGKTLEIEATCAAVPYLDENAVVTIVRDVSDRRKNKELRRRIDENIQLVNETLQYDKIRTEYFANISHEIKTPLNVIIGTLQLFELIINDQVRNEGFDRLVKYTSIMKQNCFRLLRMFNNLIYITEIDSGFIQLHCQNHNLVHIVKNILQASTRFMERKGAHLEIRIDSSSIELACDEDKIRRVLLNLLSNAVKFTEKGDEICVRLYSDEDFAYISVKDTGLGIQVDMKDVIFERFRQVDKSFTRKCEGSGIGLYLAKSLAEMHGGSIELISEYGEGSEFIVKLPLVLLENDEIAATIEESSRTYMDMVSVEFSDIY